MGIQSAGLSGKCNFFLSGACECVTALPSILASAHYYLGIPAWSAPTTQFSGHPPGNRTCADFSIDDISPEEEQAFEEAAVAAAKDRRTAAEMASTTASGPGPTATSDNSTSQAPQTTASALSNALELLHPTTPNASGGTPSQGSGGASVEQGQTAAPAAPTPQSNPLLNTTHPLSLPSPLPFSGPGGAAGHIPLEEQAQTTEEYMAICRAFIEQLRSGSAPWLLQRLNNTYGSMPEDPSEFSYWMALVSDNNVWLLSYPCHPMPVALWGC
jgi:hypothetical protein